VREKEKEKARDEICLCGKKQKEWIVLQLTVCPW
jgi:hypothetical protein